MRMEGPGGVENAQPLNSSEAFRAELAQIQQQAGQAQEESNETEQEFAEDTQEFALEDNTAGDNSDVSNNDDVGDSTDDSFDPRAPIPPSRLKKETLKRKALEEQIAKEREDRIRAQTELDMISKALQSMQNPQHQAPQENPNEFQPLDEDAHRFYNQQYAPKDEVAQVKAELHRMQMSKALDHQQEMFERSTPDFKDAYQHLLKTEVESIKYLTGNEEQAMHIAATKLQNMAQMAMQQGKNVAEVFYNISKQYGYTNTKSTKPVPRSNLDAIESNMRKSKVADVPVAAVAPGSGGGYTTLKNFEKHLYDGSPARREENAKAFHEALKRIRESK